MDTIVFKCFLKIVLLFSVAAPLGMVWANSELSDGAGVGAEPALVAEIFDVDSDVVVWSSVHPKPEVEISLIDRLLLAMFDSAKLGSSCVPAVSANGVQQSVFSDSSE